MKDQLINALKDQVKKFKEGDHVVLDGETDLIYEIVKENYMTYDLKAILTEEQKKHSRKVMEASFRFVDIMGGLATDIVSVKDTPYSLEEIAMAEKIVYSEDVFRVAESRLTLAE